MFRHDLMVLPLRTPLGNDKRPPEAQKRLTDEIAEHQASNHNYFQDGVRLLELSKKAYFPV